MPPGPALRPHGSTPPVGPGSGPVHDATSDSAESPGREAGTLPGAHSLHSVLICRTSAGPPSRRSVPVPGSTASRTWGRRVPTPRAPSLTPVPPYPRYGYNPAAAPHPPAGRHNPAIRATRPGVFHPVGGLLPPPGRTMYTPLTFLFGAGWLGAGWPVGPDPRGRFPLFHAIGRRLLLAFQLCDSGNPSLEAPASSSGSSISVVYPA